MRWCSDFAMPACLVMCVALWIVGPFTGAFNVDLPTALVHRGPHGSMFGFAVSQHRVRGVSWLLVGAPSAETDQPAVERGGAVFRCNTEVANSCQQVPFDKQGHSQQRVRDTYVRSDNKSHQWFGATLYSSGDNGKIVACAPRYVYFSVNLRRREPVGNCFVSDNHFAGFREYSPCRTSAWGRYRQGYCQAGFSAAITQDGRYLYMGAVGSFYWQGQVFSQDLVQLHNHYNTSEDPPSEDDKFLGYSMAVGEFSGDDDEDVAVGEPRGDVLLGKVVLYTSTMQNLLNITGEQMGAYFGYSIASVDINGDGLDDLVIGAPLYTMSGLKDLSYERGRVYVYQQSKIHRFEDFTSLDGEHTKGRFGMSVANIGDIDRDGYNDFAVGAPYAGENGHGIVYIYHGSPNGVLQETSQAIYAEEVREPGLRTFGFSISGGLDLDNNEYPDLLIGAYESDAAVYLRSRPVVDVEATLQIDGENITLEDRTCKLRDGTYVSCFVATICMKYSGIGTSPALGVAYQLVLDAGGKSFPRAYFLENEQEYRLNVDIPLRQGAKYCNSIYAYVSIGIRDKLSPINVELTYRLQDTASAHSLLPPVLNGTKPSNITKQVHIKKNCGDDDVCVPDLHLLARPNMDEYLIGSTGNVELNVSIHNRGEDAFEAMMYVDFPSDLNYVKVEKSKLDSITCGGAQRSSLGGSVVVCDVENPLPANKKVNFKVIFSPARLVPTASDLNITLLVNSTNPENESSIADNSVTFQLPVRVKVNMTIRGTSFPQQIFFNQSGIEERKVVYDTDIGPEVKHVYEIINRGPSLVREAEIFLMWPTHNIHDDPLLYLIDYPQVRGNCHCENIREGILNPRHIQRKARPRRELEQVPRRNVRNLEDREFQSEQDCGELPRCAVFRCVAHNLTAGDVVVLTVNSRLWQQTIAKMSQEKFQISSKMVSRVTQLQYGLRPDFIPYKVHYVSTTVILEGLESGVRGPAWWIILLAVCGGLLLLGLLALLLWKLGFFKRKRPQDEEPLHQVQKTPQEQNGYRYKEGDEAL
ncbi:integrin alpha-PS2-like [Ornithodoros turicata]|uniref:integrin alpha-PS2-like n=1 Tax=Ornithodoros turicata TaxID=34597 RepID=UPI003139B5D6